MSTQVLSPEEIAAALAGFEMITRGETDSGRALTSPRGPPFAPDQLAKLENPQHGSLALRRALSSPALGRVAAELTGAEWVQIWHVQLLGKPSTAGGAAAGAGTLVGYHQDRHYHSADWVDESEIFTAWIALSVRSSQDTVPAPFSPASAL